MPIVKTLQAHFYTTDDDKDRGNGISERYLLDANRVIGANQSWGSGLVFRDHSWDLGQNFDVSPLGLTLYDLTRVQYQYQMDNDDGWHVEIHVQATLDDGSLYEIAVQRRNIGSGSPNAGSISL